MELKVLFVEDNQKTRENLVKYFGGEIINDYTLITEGAGTFEEGIEKIGNYDYDIVILDLYKGRNDDRGEKTGLEVLAKIQSTAFIPVIFYSGLTKDIKDLSSEVVGIVNKGDGIDFLKTEIERIINSKIALLKGQIYSHLKESLRQYFWETVHGDKKIFEPIKNDISLGYLLLRRFANSLSKENIKLLLGDDKIKPDKAHPMEFYIFPSNNIEYEAGEIISKDGIFYTILTPSCDFIEDKKSSRERKVGNVLLAVATPLSKNEYYLDYKKTTSDKNKGRLAKLIEARKGDQYFFLPGTPFIENLILDFQNKVMVDYGELKSFTRIAKLDDPYAQSMVTSFVRFYNRIGFPDIDSDYVIASL